jgi:hypothetical protein
VKNLAKCVVFLAKFQTWFNPEMAQIEYHRVPEIPRNHSKKDESKHRALYKIAQQNYRASGSQVADIV